jgi:hypothetical protein
MAVRQHFTEFPYAKVTAHAAGVFHGSALGWVRADVDWFNEDLADNFLGLT